MVESLKGRKFNIDRVESHRNSVMPGLWVDPQSSRQYRLTEINGHLLVLVRISLKYFALAQVLPSFPVSRVGYFERGHPGRMVAPTLDDNASPVFGGVHADLDPFAELADGRGPGLMVVGYFVVEEVVGCGGGGEHHLGA